MACRCGAALRSFGSLLGHGDFAHGAAEAGSRASIKTGTNPPTWCVTISSTHPKRWGIYADLAVDAGRGPSLGQLRQTTAAVVEDRADEDPSQDKSQRQVTTARRTARVVGINSHQRGVDAMSETAGPGSSVRRVLRRAESQGRDLTAPERAAQRPRRDGARARCTACWGSGGDELNSPCIEPHCPELATYRGRCRRHASLNERARLRPHKQVYNRRRWATSQARAQP